MTIGEKVSIGSFVKVSSGVGKGLGVGKVTQIRSSFATVIYFDVPGEVAPFQLDAPVSELRTAALPEQTRVFRCDEATGRWQVGRVVDGDGPLCLVAFPGKTAVNVSRAELQVRWRKPIANPTEFLARQITETPRFSQARSRFMRAVTAQRAACRGMSALLSASVQLADYQFNVVQRVLQDPVQRYLLADEVGLGKTVEAGLLVRQYVLDVPGASVLIIVPRSLVAQWRQELVQRFGLRDWLDDFVFVASSEDIGCIEALLPTVGMLVVDEAHHLSRATGERLNPLYELLKRYAPQVPRLLLLSATPVLSDTAGFLRILHLLDPVVFPLDDLAAFERRVQSRQLIAEMAASLVPENVLSMEDDLDSLVATFSDDVTLMHRVETLRPIVQALPDEADEDFLSALNELRTHLTETYKLHRRILRNRRKAVPWATPRRSGLESMPYACGLRRERHELLEELRVHLLNADLIAPVALSLFGAAVHASSGESIKSALQSAAIHDVRALDLAQRIDLLSGQANDAETRQRVAVEAVQHCLETSGQQVVVFCDQASVADDLAKRLRGSIRRDFEVLRHVSLDQESAEEDAAEPWRRFLSEPERCRVLVCDAQAEEGLNLHGGSKVLLHFDLPARPNRIEQRLGRLDRFGVGDPIRSLAPVCIDDLAEQAWLACLADGLQVFSASMASLQYLVEESLSEAVSDWCNEGVGGLQRWTEQLAGPTGWAARERRRIDQQDTLDAMGDPQSDEFDDLEEVDDDWRSWREAFDGWAVNMLLFRRRPEEWAGRLTPGEAVFRLNHTRDGSHRTLLSLPDFVEQFLGTIDIESRHSTMRSPLSYPYAFRRNTVMSKEGRALGLRSLRYGDPLVESLHSFCQADDRGRVFAMWRYAPGFDARDASGVDLWFRFDFLIEANLQVADDTSRRALQRRAERHFPPQFHTVWVDAANSATMEPPEELTGAYLPEDEGNGRDFHLNPNRWEILRMQDQVPWSIEWRRHCEEAAQHAVKYIANHEAVTGHVKLGLQTLRREYETRVAQLESRVARLSGPAKSAELRELEAEGAQRGLLVDAIRLPAIRTDVAGAIFIAATTPFVR